MSAAEVLFFEHNRDMTEIYFSMRKIFLSELKVREEAVVTEENPLKYVQKYGIRSGVKIKLLGKTASGGCVVYYSGKYFAIDKQLAERITARL